MQELDGSIFNVMKLLNDLLMLRVRMATAEGKRMAAAMVPAQVTALQGLA
jgi:hypothetical protein